MAKRKEDAPPAGSPAWMSTFSDLMNLLLCFFVMLFSMSTIQEDKLAALVASMNNTFSIFDAGATAIGEGILISNGVSQLNELDQYINSTGKTADSDTEGENFEEFEKSPDATEKMEEILEQEKLQQNEETAEKLEKCDVNILHEYILEEYKSRLIERKETRRHQSLNKSLEHGFDVIDKNLDLEDIVFQKIEAERLHKALTELTSEQRQLIEKIYFKEEKQTDIARE